MTDTPMSETKWSVVKFHRLKTKVNTKINSERFVNTELSTTSDSD